ncbi:MAG TPA: ATP-binding protein [Gemmatimonadales bacterium]|nr:ATP-binding protein [Gemmatimonadales bacterium]
MTAEDVAAQLARERALKQAEKMETIGRLTGAIAQQFNELLTAILARTAALAQSLPSNRDIDELKLTAQRGTELAQRLLGFSRHRVLDLHPLILTEFVRDALDTLRRDLPAGIEVQFEADEEGGVVEADPAAVKQILLHLVTNARDAMPKGGTLHVEVRRARLGAADRPLHAWVEPGSYVSVALSDTGVGMDAQTLARVFEPFFTTKPVGVGTGLGMSMAYGLVKQHRGYLHIYSEVGQGTTVKVYFPALRDQGMSEVETPDEGLPGGTESILLVEDDQTMRVAAQQLLSKVGYRVFTAVDGEQGLDAFRAHRADLRLIITDVVMPKLSGFDMYEVIRGESRGLSVLFMSGFPAPNFRKTVGQDPAVAFVTKPWTASELLAQVRLMIDAPRA